MYVSQMPPARLAAVEAVLATPSVLPELMKVSMWLRQTCCEVGMPAPRTVVVVTPAGPDLEPAASQSW